ncbi:EamA family transporter [Nocardioides halotolerans]|uniref:EamA family transporter n=1 Tax=Nocardioides halotolerans TaxID=433660 RepID=UPI00041C22F2|nr:EamA family transporter [Nocardioides halotolerans]
MATGTILRGPTAAGVVLVVVGATFHYLGPSFAVLLFTHLDAVGVAWLRMATAALVLALLRPPWAVWGAAGRHERLLAVALGIVLAVMNATFYLALERLPLATVAGIEFLGVIVLAAYGARTRRNAAALALTVAGVALLTQVRIAGTPVGLLLAAGNCVGFMLYVVVGHRLANVPSRGGSPALDRLSLVVAIGAIVSTPFGVAAATPAVRHPTWLLWGLGVGICSTVIPYLTDQLAMVRLPRATYSLMLALLPVTATVCGIAVLHQLPGRQDLAGLALVVAGVAAHRSQEATTEGGPTDGPHDARRQRSGRLAARARDDELRRHQPPGLAPRPGGRATDRAARG